jgi:pimeloyl-ACP methyl ester carboxylesterase
MSATARLAGFTERFAKVNGVRLRYQVGGRGSAVVLLHGYAETGHMWRPIMPLLAERHTVVVPDLRGAGGSAKPASGYDKNRPVYVVCAAALYLNVFVGVVQAFLKVSVLHALAPQQTEPPFLISQLAVLVLFVVLTVLATKRFRGHATPRPRSTA